MVRKRPCAICRRWFRPDPRLGVRQRACGSGSCQRERHRRACGAWRRRNPHYDRDDRLRRRLHRAEAAVAPLGVDPLARVDWAVARDAIGLQAAVIVEETGRVLAGWARDAMVAQRRVGAGEIDALPPPRARDAMGSTPCAP